MWVRVARIALLLMASGLAACATKDQTVRDAPWGEAAGFAISQAQSADGMMGCTASRTQLVQGRQQMMAVGLYRVPNGGSVVALAGGISGSSLGDRRQVPVQVTLGGGATEPGLGSLTGPRFMALTSAGTLPGLAQGGTAVISFEGGPVMRQRFAPAVVEGVVRCYSDVMASNGLMQERTPVARPVPPQFKDGTADIMRVRIE
jgi:hypothetical protein